MSKLIKKKRELRHKRQMRVRKSLIGTSLRPRLCVVKTNKHIQAQLIDDETGRTLGAVSTGSAPFKGGEHARKNKASARKLGEEMANIASKLNVKEVVFDRGPFKYHGILAELAEGARSSGLQF